MSEDTGCERLSGRLRQLCRGEVGTVDACNHTRAGWGLAPLPTGWQIPTSLPATVSPHGPFPCIHRGEHLRSLGLKLLCGCDQQVYRCALLGECVRHRPPELKTGDTLRAAIAGQGIAVCADCERRESPDSMKAGPS